MANSHLLQAAGDAKREVLVQKVAGGITVGAGGGTFIFGMSVNEIVAIAGLCIAVASFGLSWFYQRKRDRREEALMREQRER
jgi:hypothetical protein